MNPSEGTVAWAEAVLGPELAARARAEAAAQPCNLSPKTLERLRQIFAGARPTTSRNLRR